MTATNITRNKAIEGLENFGLFQPYITVGKYEIPTISPVYELPTLKWIDFSAARSFRGNGKEIGVHFFTDDYRFNSVWLQAAKYSEMLDRLQPRRVLCCGDVLDFMAQDVLVEQFGAFCDKFRNFRKEE